MSEFYWGVLTGIILCTGIAYWSDPVAHGYRIGCLAADPSRVVIEVAGQQRCLTQEQAKVIAK